MTANASASVLQILIGADNQDWSAARMGLEVGVNQRDRSGLFKITGTLTLGCVNTAPESMNPRLNQSRWCRGQRILVNEINSTGGYVRHRYGWLYILKEPAPPAPKSPKLELEVGCILSLKDFAEPTEDQSGINLGTSTTRTTAIGSLLAAAGITTWVGSVPLYPIAYPLPKERGSYVAQAGEIAYAGLKALMQLNDGTITAVDLPIPGVNATPLMTVTIGRDEVQYQPQLGAETPVEEMIATGVSVNVVDTWGELSDCSFGYAPGSAKIIRKSCFYQKADATTELYRTTTYEPKGMVLPQDYHGVQTLVLSTETENTKTYEDKFNQQVFDYSGQKSFANGKLLQEQSRTVRPFAAAILSLWNNLSAAQKAKYAAFFPAQSDLTTTDYLYECKDTLRGKQTNSKGLLGAILSDLDITVESPTSIVPSGSSSEIYREDRPNIWTYLKLSASPLVQAYPDAIEADDTIAEKIQLVTTSEPPSISPTQNQPPATERRPDRYARIEFFIRGTAQFGTFAGAQEQSRSRTIEVKYCSDIAQIIANNQRSCLQVNESPQLAAIAQMEGQLLIGRRQGQRVKLPIGDLWLSDANPCAVIVCREPVLVNDQIVYDEYTFMIDGLHCIHNRTSSIVAFDAIWLATKPHDQPMPQLPFMPIFLDSCGAGTGSEDRMVPYTLLLPVQNDSVGMGMGLVDSAMSIAPTRYDAIGMGMGIVDAVSLTSFDAVGMGMGLVDFTPYVYDAVGMGMGLADTSIITGGMTSPSAYWNLATNGNAAAGSTNFTAGSAITFASGSASSDGSTGGTLIAADSSDIAIGNAKHTWGAWINFDNISNTPFFLSKGFVPGIDYPSASFEWTLYYDSSANRFKLAWYLAGAGNSGTNTTLTASTLGAATTGNWYFVVFYYQPGTPNTLGISVNNGAFDTLTTTIDHISSGQNLTAFHRSQDGQYTAAKMRDVGFWKDLPGGVSDGTIDLAYYYNSGNGRSL